MTVSTNAYTPSARAQIITRRTYSRPKDDGSFESWDEIVSRVLSHQRWLWERAKGAKLGVKQEAEMTELGELLRARKVGVAGRTLWLGGTTVSKTREASNFNCSFTKVESINDVVDVLWLLLQGCGTGFAPVVGTLSGFTKPIHNIEVVRSARTLEEFERGERGREHNVEIWDSSTGTWTISVGDSAEAWAKSIGKLLAGKHVAQKLVLDFSQIRAPGVRLKGYGWVAQGDTTIAEAYQAIAKIMNRRAGQLLRKMDIHDVVNWLGTILSTRRSAQISLFDYGTPEWQEFAACKKDYWFKGQMQRGQSNNSLVFYSKPSKEDLSKLFAMMLDAGGSEPGMINGEEALNRAPWFSGLNPCAEVLLANKGFCNLVTVDLAKFRNDPAGLYRAVHIIARANYRQTCVNLRDGILQDTWHENNEFLRLCGVSLTGLARRPDIGAYELRTLKNCAVVGAYSMADELGLPRPKNVTTEKPEGTGSKCYDTTEGIHKPLAKYIFNNVAFGQHDPLVPLLRKANYTVFQHPNGFDWIATLPVSWEDVEFETVGNMEVNLESAVSQLNRYKQMMDNYVEQNCSITVSYNPEEVPAIVDWLDANWGHYVGVSFLLRADPTKTAADLGYPYLPQQPVTREVYEEYVKSLGFIDIDKLQEDKEGEIDTGSECATGACPVR